MSVPLDGDGFLRRECPTCEREFKWLPSSEERGEPLPAGGYFCPYCAVQAPPGSWWTKPQLAKARAIVTSEVLDPELDKLRRTMGERERSPGGLIQARLEGSLTEEIEPIDLSEANDMRRIDFTCHPADPIKVSEDWKSPVHCLICGTEAG